MGVTYFILRNGEIRMGPIDLEKDSDGFLWQKAKKKNPLLNKTVFEEKGFTQEQVANFGRSEQFDKIPREAFCQEGMNPDGLEVITLAEYQRRAKEERERIRASRTPAEIERDAIDTLYYRAESVKDTEDDQEYYDLRIEAKNRFEKWKINYPEDWKKEQAHDLIHKAEHEESMAVGALTFDMDGSLSREDQHRRHDEFLAKAKKLRQEAEELLLQGAM